MILETRRLSICVFIFLGCVFLARGRSDCQTQVATLKGTVHSARNEPLSAVKVQATQLTSGKRAWSSEPAAEPLVFAAPATSGVCSMGIS